MARRRSGPSKRTEIPSAPAPPPAPVAPAVLKDDAKAAEVPETGRRKLVDELERELDRILFRIMSEGGMPEIERQIRLCRRLLILGSAE
jgi:hypothetical protein